MPARIDVDTQPMRPGETRPYTVYGSGLLAVAVKCWVTEPPPPEFRTCPACGSQQMGDGDVGQIAVPLDFTEGSIQISIEDSDGGRADATISVGRTQQRRRGL